MLEHYTPQLCQQAYVCGFQTCDFTVYNDTADEVFNLEVIVTELMIDKVMEQVLAFRELLKLEKTPALTNLDVMSLDPFDSYRSLFSKLIEAKKNNQKKAFNSLRSEIIEIMPHNRVECLGVKATRSIVGRTTFRFDGAKDLH